MILLRIYPSRGIIADNWSWVLMENGRALAEGNGKLSELPGHASRLQLVLPADSVLLTRAKLPGNSKRLSGSLLAFAIEEEMATEPENNTVIALGSLKDAEATAAVDGSRLSAYRNALESAGFNTYEILCETLMLPLADNSWSLHWDGREGFVRSAPIEGFATDTGQRAMPPMALQLRLNDARKHGDAPAEIVVHPSATDLAPDVAQWEKQLGLPVRLASPWTWRSAQAVPTPVLLETRRRWAPGAGMLAKLRPAAWITVAALTIHLAAVSLHWLWLAQEQRSLRQEMESRFRSAFPDATAVVDPALQMRRKLADIRHTSGFPDSSDFLPLLDRAAPLISTLSAGTVRNLTYSNGRITLELDALDSAGMERLAGALQRAGLIVERSSTGRPASQITISAS